MSQETPAFDPREFAKGIVAPNNPYAGYDARKAELAEKDHPWANSEAGITTPADTARAAAHEYYQEEFRLTGADTRTPEELAIQAQTNKLGRAAVEAALAEAKTDNQ
jgi:hypothetical protein